MEKENMENSEEEALGKFIDAALAINKEGTKQTKLLAKLLLAQQHLVINAFVSSVVSSLRSLEGKGE